MPAAAFEAFRAELQALGKAISDQPNKTIRDTELRDRFRTLFRSWVSVVEPRVRQLLPSRRDLHKLTAEIEALAKLTSKIKPCTEYRRRIKRAIALADGLVLYLPPTVATYSTGQSRSPSRQEFFASGIPDLPVSLVPSAILGWKTNIEQFLLRYPFDRSVFVMIRYRDRNASLISAIREELTNADHALILASDHRITDDLYNPIACLLCCAKGLAVFDAPEADQVFNPNVAYELGMMHLLSRECRILKHADLQVLPTDILMKLYLSFKDIGEAREHIRTWLGAHTD